MGLRLAEMVVAWYLAYLQTLVQRDVRDLARIASLDVIPRLLELAAGQTAHFFNVSTLTSPFGDTGLACALLRLDAQSAGQRVPGAHRVSPFSQQ